MTTSNVTSGQHPSGLVVSGGEVLNVLAGGTITGADIQAGGTVTVSVGGVDFGATIATGGFEFVYGSANGDMVAGSQTVSTGTAAGIVSNETVLNGGVVLLAVKTTSAVGTTVDSGGALDINGNISATDTTLSGGTIDLESAKATLTGGLLFAAGGTLLVTGNTSAGSGDLAVISGFGVGDVIDMTAATDIGAAAVSSLTLSTSGGNTVAVVSGGGAADTYYFSGTAIAATLTLTSDNAGGQELIVTGPTSAVTSIGAGSSVSGLSVSTSPLTVYNGGTIVAASILSGGLVTISAGGLDSGSTISGGGSETVLGAANADSISSGGTLTLSGGGTATNTTIAGGSVILQTPTDTLAGSLIFDGPGTIAVNAVSTEVAGDQAVIAGFYAGDVLEVTPFGSGTVLTTSTNAASNTVATLTSGTQSESFTFAGAIAANLTLSTATGVADIDYAGPPTTTAYTAGDLVLSVYGDGSGTGSYSLDQAAPITLEEITQSGQIVSVQELPQTTVVVNGTTEYAISGEYESASEGLLTLAGNGQSVVIAGYGVNAVAFDAPDAASVYGTTALGQTSSLLGGQYTTVERVVADISYNAQVDTSTSLSGVFNTNNPRSVYTVNGTSFYLGGQGNGADGTEGVFFAADGASTATPVYNTKTDVRDVAVYNGQLYVSVDSKLNGGAGLYEFASTLPTGQTAPIELKGIGATLTLTAAEANVVNGAAVGSSVNLSPEQYFFADPTTLYIADGGDPRRVGPAMAACRNGA